MALPVNRTARITATRLCRQKMSRVANLTPGFAKIFLISLPGRTVYKPVLVLTLSAITPLTYDRLVDFFPGVLNLYLVYGASKLSPKGETGICRSSLSAAP